MDRDDLRSFIKTAEAALTGARGSLLLIAQDVGTDVDLTAVARHVAELAALARKHDLAGIAKPAAECSEAILDAEPSNALKALDAIAAVEAELLSLTLADDDDVDILTSLLDVSLNGSGSTAEAAGVAHPQFSIDADTLEIFRSEGESLLANISLSADVLAASPSDKNALWDIRRSAHTFKGAAGIVGLTEAAALAHRMEDLLDRLVGSDIPSSAEVIEFLQGCVRSLGGVLDGAPANAAGLEMAYSGAIASLANRNADAPVRAPTDTTKDRTTPGRPAENKPTVRVSIDRLSEILSLAEQLLVVSDWNGLACQLRDRLIQIRMVRFGTLETRLSRAVHITATEEGKKAVLDIETPAVEIDTLIVDAIVEPLLHLIKNAVVHGIEPPEFRRMIGKHEFGLITVRVEADDEAVVVTLADDGAGIAVSRLKERAVDRQSISPADAGRMTDREAFKLLFDKGLTTADTITLNAGRGVGMSIVKEAVESRGGSVHVESTPQLGTTFTLMLPVSHSHTPAVPALSTLHSPLSTSPLVLIVDDSASIRRQTQRIVEEAGLRSITAEHGADALELLLNGSVVPDLILSDIEMPHMDGLALLEYLKTDDHLGHVPVVMVTSLDSEEYQAKALDLGAAGYVVKPFGEKDIERVLALATAEAR